MLCSGNDSAIQIAITVSGSIEQFVSLMNKKIEELGLKDTHFTSPHGLDMEGHYTTAYELAQIADYALNNEKFAEVVKTKTYTVHINGYNKTITNTNELLGYLNGVNGVKTGFTNGAGRCLVTSVNRDKFNIITVVLGADTKKSRTKDSINLIEYVYSNFELINLEGLINDEYENWKRINDKRIFVNKGKGSIETKLEDFKYKKYPIKKEDIKNINIEIKNAQIVFEAPVYKKEKVGCVILSIDNNEIMKINIETKNTIKRKRMKDYFLEVLKEMA